jgi:hypothetical protein
MPQRQARKRRTINDVRHDLASAARALRVHAENLGRMRAEMKLRPALRLIPDRMADLKAEAEHCEEIERTILKHFNAAVRKAAKEVP